MTFSALKTDQRLIRLSIAVVLLLLIMASVFYNPTDYNLTDCRFKQLTGLSCPTCGMTRSFHAGANLNFAQAFTFHWIGPILLLGSIFLFLKYSIESVSGKAIQYKSNTGIIKVALLIIGIVWLIFWMSSLISEISA